MGKLKSAASAVFGSLIRLKGNAKVNILVQPLFSIPNNLYSTYATLYMLALGLTTTQIGMISAVNMVSQLALSLVSFYVVDRYGRKAMSILGDFVGWLIPVFLWATAQDMNAFLLAALVNGFVRINVPAYNCIIQEGYDSTERFHIYTWMQVANLIGWFFVPIGGWLVATFGLVPAERAMYWTAFISYTVMFLIRLPLIKETDIGKKIRGKMKGVNYFRALKSYLPGAKSIFKDKALMLIMLMNAFACMAYTFRNTYIGVITTRKLGFADSDVSVFMTVNAIVMMLVLFFVMPFFNRRRSRAPIFIGYILDLTGVAILLFAPAGNIFVVIFAVVLMAAGYGMDNPCTGALLANLMRNDLRSIATMISGSVYLILSTPMSYLVGTLADIDDSIPFIISGILYIVSLGFYAASRKILRERDERSYKDAAAVTQGDSSQK